MANHLWEPDIPYQITVQRDLLFETSSVASNASFGINQPSLIKSILVGTLLSCIAFATILGNLLVILSVCVDRHLHSPPNILIVNLAVADLLVGLLVMPFGIAELVGRPWIWGRFTCELYISADVICCTASIVNLCMISVDRYLAITRPFKYAQKRTPRLMLLMVFIVWVLGASISISPQIWGNEYSKYKCLLTQEKLYTIYSTGGAFYFPLIVMLIVYYKIYRAAKLSQKAEMQRRPSILPNSRRSSHASENSDLSGRRMSLLKFADYLKSKARPSIVSMKHGNGKFRISLRGERKAAKTLGVIMGAFILCWLPFFLLALVRPFCNCIIPPLLNYILLWLGYVNSTINPVIYPLFNKDFVPAYKRLLGCKCLGEFVHSHRSSLRYSYSGPTRTAPNVTVQLHADSKRDGNDINIYSKVGENYDTADIAATDLLNGNVIVDRRTSDLEKISEASDESGCEV